MPAEPDFVALTVRRLKPDSYEAWRKAWHDPDDPDALWVEQESKAYIVRNVDDPNEIIAFGFMHGDASDFLPLRNEPEVRRKQQRRSSLMAPHVEDVLVDGSYEVIEVVKREDARSPS